MKKILIMVMFAVLFGGCYSRVEPGYVGMIMEPNGLTKDVLQPGNHFVGPRSKLILVEKQEMKNSEKLSILCADDLNFSFDIVIRSRLNVTNGKALQDVLDRQGSLIDEYNVLRSGLLYSKYVQPAVLDIARSVVNKYETTSIRANRDEIRKEIMKRVKEQMEGTPMEVVAVYLNNFDYPKIITDAMERTKKRQVEIKEREAQKAMQLLDAKARREVAEQEKATRVAEAESEAAYNLIVAKSVTPQYLELRRIELDLKKVEVQRVLYNRVGQGDKVIITGENSGTVMPILKAGAQ